MSFLGFPCGSFAPYKPPKTPQGHVQSYQTYSGQSNAQRMIKTKLSNFSITFVTVRLQFCWTCPTAWKMWGLLWGGKCCFFPTAIFSWDRVFKSSLLPPHASPSRIKSLHIRYYVSVANWLTKYVGDWSISECKQVAIITLLAKCPLANIACPFCGVQQLDQLDDATTPHLKRTCHHCYRSF